MKSMIFILLLLMSVVQIGCQNTSENSLVGDFSPSSTCPNGGCVVTSGNGANSAYIVASSNQYNLGLNDRRVDIGGECFDGNVAYNKIIVSYDSAQPAFPVLPDSAIAITSGIVNNQSSLICKNGRFDFSLPSTITDKIAPGVALKIRIAFQLFDANYYNIKVGARGTIAVTVVRMTQ